MKLEEVDAKEESIDGWPQPGLPQQLASQFRPALYRNASHQTLPVGIRRGTEAPKAAPRLAKPTGFASFEQNVASSYGNKRGEQIDLRAPIPISSLKNKLLLELSASDKEKPKNTSRLNTCTLR